MRPGRATAIEEVVSFAECASCAVRPVRKRAGTNAPAPI